MSSPLPGRVARPTVLPKTEHAMMLGDQRRAESDRKATEFAKRHERPKTPAHDPYIED